jgi:hypothetical protein
MSIVNNELRWGNFTSSKISALMSNGKATGSLGKPATTYIAEKKMERRLGRSLTTENNAKPLVWGRTLETIPFSKLGMEYQIISQETIQHPDIKFWTGSPDAKKHSQPKAAVCDFKAPITLKSFCELVDPLYEGLTGTELITAVRDRHEHGDMYYWQLVSNAILTGVDVGELIVYVPYYSEIPNIKQICEGNPNAYWIWTAAIEELTWIPDEGYYKDVNVISFPIPQEDKDALTERVLTAGKILNEGNEPERLPALREPKPLTFKKL